MNPTAYEQPIALSVSPKKHRVLTHQYFKRPGRRSRPQKSPYRNEPPPLQHPTPLERALELCDKLDKNFPTPRNRIRLLREDVTGNRLPINPFKRKNKGQRTRLTAVFALLNWKTAPHISHNSLRFA